MKSETKKPETKNTTKKAAIKKTENTKFCEVVVLKPVGYPFNFNLMESDLEITDINLFEEYAREQWLGIVVKEGSYLFDQKIIPDYGFKIISAEPNESIISEKTKIKLIE